MVARASAQLVVEGQEEGEVQHGMMGRYELMEGKVVNGRGVWQRKKGKEGQKEMYLYYASTQEWFIGTKATMEAGEATGYVRSAATASALTPDQAAAGKWQAVDRGKFTKAPKVRVRAVEAAEWAAMVVFALF